MKFILSKLSKKLNFKYNLKYAINIDIMFINS
jgi:hypothetical protein